jgi:DNA-directed RNA polymerase subunit RPC12/RpoP
MVNLFERILYLRELAETIDINNNTKERKLMSAMIDTMEDIVKVITNKQEHTDNEFVNFQYVCPNCNEKIQINESSFENNDNIICPKCNGAISILSQEL